MRFGFKNNYKAIILTIIVLTCSPFLYQFTKMVLIHVRHRMQEHFAEIHALLSDQDEDQLFNDGTLSPQQIAARDNVVTPIETAPDMISWAVLAQADTRVEEHPDQNIIIPVYNQAIMQLDDKNLTAKGYMFPLDIIGKQNHFLLSPYPPSCPFCKPAGPNELIEIKMAKPIDFTYDPVVVRGHFEVMTKNTDVSQGVFYRMEDAKVKS